ncbi:MAG: peptidylprolyl isomerase [Candidatus Sumerlaeaceae bacterium]|jgi:peptidyl-prolyl cis-trans isomerase C|nr:peptidylprolyl isomerase [Candidatus Sumerlaeaceae bacterium]
MPTEVRASHILVKTEQEALNLKKKIDSGEEKFHRLAKRFSQCPSGRDGGDLGFFKRGMMVPEFEEVAFGSAIGKVSQPVKTQFGYHLILVTETRD